MGSRPSKPVGKTGATAASHVHLGVVDAQRLDLEDDVPGFGLGSGISLDTRLSRPPTFSGTITRMAILQIDQGVRKSRIAAAISLACVSSAKWPVSKKRTTASGMSRVNASAPAGRKNGSLRPHTARNGGLCVRKYA